MKEGRVGSKNGHIWQMVKYEHDPGLFQVKIDPEEWTVGNVVKGFRQPPVMAAEAVKQRKTPIIISFRV